jgi:hypothetical protein
MSKLKSMLSLEEDCSQFCPKWLPNYENVFNAIYKNLRERNDSELKRTESIK